MLTSGNSSVGFAITGYPASSDYRKTLEQTLRGSLQYLSLPELRQLPFRELLQTLRGIRTERLYLPLEDDSMLALLPSLEILASATRARTIVVVYPDLHCKTLKRWRAALSLVSFVMASLGAVFELRRCRRESSQLLSLPRIAATPPVKERVLYLKTNLMLGVKAGGSVGHVAGVVNELSRSGYDVNIASAEAPSGLDSKVKWLPVPLMPYLSAPFESNYYRYNLAVIKQLGAWLKENPVSFIYQRMSTGNYAGVVLSRQTHVPLVLEYNNSELWTARNWGGSLKFHDLALQTEDVCLRHSHLIVTVSDVLKEELQGRGVSPDRIVVYPNCIDPELFNPERFSRAETLRLREGYKIDPDAIVVTFLGTFGQWHGAEVLAKAIRQMVDSDAEWLRSRKVHFLMIGDGVRMSAVREILSKGRCMPFVTLTGLVKQSEAPIHLAASDILVSPHVPNADGTRFFGSPTKLFEYMAMGKAIIASDLEQIGEVLKNSLRAESLHSATSFDAATAVLCRPGDESDLINGIQLLAGDSHLRNTLGSNARNLVLSKYSWLHHVKAIVSRLTALFSDHEADAKMSFKK